MARKMKLAFDAYEAPSSVAGCVRTAPKAAPAPAPKAYPAPAPSTPHADGLTDAAIGLQMVLTVLRGLGYHENNGGNIVNDLERIRGWCVRGAYMKVREETTPKVDAPAPAPVAVPAPAPKATPKVRGDGLVRSAANRSAKTTPPAPIVAPKPTPKVEAPKPAPIVATPKAAEVVAKPKVGGLSGYRALQQVAKALGIKANGKTAELQARIDAAKAKAAPAPKAEPKAAAPAPKATASKAKTATLIVEETKVILLAKLARLSVEELTKLAKLVK